MKTSTKALLFSVALIPTILLVSAFTQQTTETKYATMRTMENAMGSSKIFISYEGKTEELELDRPTNGNMASNTLKINQAINMLSSKGYELVCQSGGDMYSMYSFVKK